MDGHRQGLNRSFSALRQLARGIVSGTERGWERVQGDSNINSTSREKEKEMKVTYLFINGILTKPGDVNNWTERACSWVDENTKNKADRFEYASDAIFRRLYQEQRVNDLQIMVNRITQGEIILVGHSNGCDLIERLVKRNTHYFKEIHLIAGASERDFEKNGYNDALKNKKVGEIFMYVSPQDSALKEAKWSTRLFGWLGLGYGYIGLSGPSRIAKQVNFRTHVIDKKYEHSEWFLGKNLDETLKLVTHTK